MNNIHTKFLQGLAPQKIFHVINYLRKSGLRFIAAKSDRIKFCMTNVSGNVFKRSQREIIFFAKLQDSCDNPRCFN